MTGLEDETYSNSLGMNLTKIEAGEFYLGFEGNTLPDALVGRETHRQNGDFDEHPAHKVKISQSFHISICQVTNAQYEQFDPEHRKLRGKRGFSTEDDEAVVAVAVFGKIPVTKIDAGGDLDDLIRLCLWDVAEQSGLDAECDGEKRCQAEHGQTNERSRHRNLPHDEPKFDLIYYENKSACQIMWNIMFPSNSDLDENIKTDLVGK